MYHLRLCKALSYTGVVSATKQQPDVFVEDKATADKAVATGYFQLVNDPERGAQEEKGHLDKGQFEEWDMDALKELAGDMGLDTSGFKDKQDYIDAICAEEVGYCPEPAEEEQEPAVDYEALSKKTKAELTAYANANGIDVSKCNTKAEILGEISAAHGGSRTMMDLQEV